MGAGDGPPREGGVMAQSQGPRDRREEGFEKKRLTDSLFKTDDHLTHPFGKVPEYHPQHPVNSDYIALTEKEYEGWR